MPCYPYGALRKNHVCMVVYADRLVTTRRRLSTPAVNVMTSTGGSTWGIVEHNHALISNGRRARFQQTRDRRLHVSLISRKEGSERVAWLMGCLSPVRYCEVYRTQIAKVTKETPTFTCTTTKIETRLNSCSRCSATMKSPPFQTYPSAPKNTQPSPAQELEPDRTEHILPRASWSLPGSPRSDVDKRQGSDDETCEKGQTSSRR